MRQKQNKSLSKGEFLKESRQRRIHNEIVKCTTWILTRQETNKNTSHAGPNRNYSD
ncbi:hypothetical protein DPMN_028879 [Dreissena polymorpha]|uniref:Uncharacterized protein n=1 Tax=Dreissena polymorpha TaxID=45954 RepID=A0A9D4LVH2_DREPO|nr:hypothetical protein DPMN_028879 [Dreissena polymorpha]